MAEEKQKTCFVISPIGEENSPVRIHADKIFEHVIKPAVEECGYATPKRADHDPRPSMITNTIIEHIWTDDLVVAVLTYNNANVFYELAARHIQRKPCVHMIQATSQPTAFDVSGMHIIQYDQEDWDSIETSKKALVKEIKSAEKGEGIINPITSAVALQKSMKSDDASIKESAFMLEQTRQLLGSMRQIESSVRQMVNRQSGVFVNDPFRPQNPFILGSAEQDRVGTPMHVSVSPSYFEPPIVSYGGTPENPIKVTNKG